MILIRSYNLITFLVFIYSDCFASSFLQKNEIGLRYSVVREYLIKAGDKPIDQTKVHINCDIVDDICSAYPEVSACQIGAVDQPVRCGFEWKSKTGQRFGVFTSGDNLTYMTVTEVDPTPQSLISNGSVE